MAVGSHVHGRWFRCPAAEQDAWTKRTAAFRAALAARHIHYRRASPNTVAGRLLLLYVVWCVHGIAWEDAIDDLAYTNTGKPYFRHLPGCFSISHSKGMAMVCIAGEEVGVDVQEAGDMRLAFAAHFLHPEEAGLMKQMGDSREKQAFMARIWTRKEALAKCSGDGIALPRLPRVSVLAEHICPAGGRAIHLVTHEIHGQFIYSVASTRKMVASVLDMQEVTRDELYKFMSSLHSKQCKNGA